MADKIGIGLVDLMLGNDAAIAQKWDEMGIEARTAILVAIDSRGKLNFISQYPWNVIRGFGGLALKIAKRLNDPRRP